MAVLNSTRREEEQEESAATGPSPPQGSWKLGSERMSGLVMDVDTRETKRWTMSHCVCGKPE